jgi:hypothetical protein
MADKKLTIKASLTREFTVHDKFEREEQVGVADLFIGEVQEQEPDDLVDLLKFEVVGETSGQGGRTARDVAEEWQGVCSEALDDKALIDALCIFVENRGLTDQLDDFLRKIAEEASDPAAE